MTKYMGPILIDRAKDGRRRVSAHGVWALLAMLGPAFAFPGGLFLLRADPRFVWLNDVGQYPWEFWALAFCGTIATLGGGTDWLMHRSGNTVVGKKEHQAHLAALAGGGLPLFVLMSFASLSAGPASYLIPVIVVLIFTVVMISYDEFIFHRRCGWGEIITHRLLTFGNGLAFLAWAHWCFVRGGCHV